jgi:hypothetical protein
MTLSTLSNFKLYHKSTNDFGDTLNLASSLSGYGKPLVELLKYASENKSSDKRAILNQIIYTAYSFFDELDTVKQLLYEGHTFKGNNIKNRYADTVIVSNQLAFGKVLREAGKQKILMINESHYDWRHRYFVTLLLDSLFKKGYKYLCMEALNNEDSINKRKFPTSDDGYYFKEPFMANLARAALKIGYKLVEYEDTTDNLNASAFNSPVDKREYYQALNLYRQYKKDTLAKWLVYAGYSHTNKLEFSSLEPSTMAKYFSEFSHINPYTINQTTYCDIFSSKVAFDSGHNNENYYYLRNDQIYDSTLLKQSDLYIINNIHTIPYEKPGTNNSFQKYYIHYDIGKTENRKYFVKVFLTEEYLQNRHSIPIYIKRISEGAFYKNIWLPKNNYYLAITDEKDKIIYEHDL